MRGWWNMACFNGLNAEQQRRIIEWGNLPLGYKPTGECPNGAEVEITTMYDTKPGPRFYCLECGAKYLNDVLVNGDRTITQTQETT